jgi:hypothetical protein
MKGNTMELTMTTPVADFPYVPATKRSLTCRKTVFGVGINDAPYVTTVRRKDHPVQTCPFYSTWKGIIERGYSPKLHTIRPTYKDASVDERWLSFMTFRAWMEGQDWEGLEIDKDILVPGNKIYGPEFCVFVTGRVNKLLTNCEGIKGRWPIGVSLDKRVGRFMAICNNGSKSKHIGLFDTPEQAHAAYCQRKAEVITEVAHEQSDIRVKTALLLRADDLYKIAELEK